MYAFSFPSLFTFVFIFQLNSNQIFNSSHLGNLALKLRKLCKKYKMKIAIHVKVTSIDIQWCILGINHYHSVMGKKKEVISHLNGRNTLERFHKCN